MATRVLPGHFRHARVALLSTWHPEPVDNGRKQRTRIIIDALSSQHEVILISLVDPTQASESLLPDVPGVTSQFQMPLPVFRSKSLDGLRGVFSQLPRSIVSTWCPDLSQQINNVLNEHEVGVAIGTDLRTLRYLMNLPEGIARILDEPDVSPFATGTDSSQRSLRAKARERKYRHYLGTTRENLDAVVVASEREDEALTSLAAGPGTIIANVVPGLPADSWHPKSATELLYTGALTYQPNLDAVNFLVNDVLSCVEPEHPGLRLTVTGKIPDPLPAVCANPLVEMTGVVPSLERYYLESRLFVVPLLAGTGTRIKLLEAMSYGMPVVSTRKGVEGLPVIHGEHVLLADTADDLTGAILLLLEDMDLCRRLGASARKLVADQFTASTTAERWQQLVSSVATNRTKTGRHD